jgi:hypothetical protein
LKTEHYDHAKEFRAGPSTSPKHGSVDQETKSVAFPSESNGAMTKQQGFKLESLILAQNER